MVDHKKTLSLRNLIDLQTKRDEKVKCIIPSNELLQLQNLESIDVCKCKFVEEVFEVEGTNEGTNSESEIVVEIPNLRLMNLWSLKSLKYIWKSNQRKVLKFPNLTTFSIEFCDSLKHVFTSSMVGGLLQLQHLRVMYCKNMEVIVKIEEEDEVKEEMELFPCLKSLKLKALYRLKGFCLGKAKTVRKTELRIVRNYETKKIFKVLNFWTRSGTRRRFEDPSRYATDLKYLKSSGFLRDLDFERNEIVRIVDYCLDDG
ncbi:hypothetical protein E3N88_00079 [Mikania micrantha]|uniref:Disease resistance protein At4g27190-like leucine-rich repeats domain-containing protein n=1 Tax=Mikania micrantha TaxID=192012 RepID=A0A5N6PXY2_9ASTR|nr:hypothetical protein E3N88_00079 [Mikania micrantha]